MRQSELSTRDTIPLPFEMSVLAMRSSLAVVLLLLMQIAQAQVDATSVDFDSQTITIALTQESPQLNGMKAEGRKKGVRAVRIK